MPSLRGAESSNLSLIAVLFNHGWAVPHWCRVIVWKAIDRKRSGGSIPLPSALFQYAPVVKLARHARLRIWWGIKDPVKVQVFSGAPSWILMFVKRTPVRTPGKQIPELRLRELTLELCWEFGSKIIFFFTGGSLRRQLISKIR